MKRLYLLLVLSTLALRVVTQTFTDIPNSGFETWIDYGSYDNPQYWDSPNEELSAIPFFGTTVVTRSNDHNSGAYSARLESKEITLVGGVPGFLTTGTLTVDIMNMTYTISGGTPVEGIPAYLKGFYRFLPKGGDSCAIGIGLTRWTGTERDSIGIGYFSTKDTVPDWTPFTALIEYDTTAAPDSMIIMAFSSAQMTPTAGTVLYIDDLWLDYAVGISEADPSDGIAVYNDLETRRLLVFTDFRSPQSVVVNLFSMSGRKEASASEVAVTKAKVEVSYDRLPDGIYILEVIHDNLRFSRKYFIAR